MGEQVEKYYLLTSNPATSKVTIPFHSVIAVGLRRVVKNGEIQKILD